MPYDLPQGQCSFCAYLANVAESVVVARTELATCMVNHRQRSNGSLLVVPRRHATWLGDLTDAETAQIAALTRYAARRVYGAFDPDGLHLWWSVGTLAAQSEAHFHVQVVPRYEGVPYTFAPSGDLAVTDREVRLGIAAALREASEAAPSSPAADGCPGCAPDEWSVPVGGTDDLVTVMPRRSRTDGAVVVLTRRHAGSFAELDQKEATALFRHVRDVSLALRRGRAIDGLHTWLAIGRIADQDLPHAYVELVPRVSGDGYAWAPMDAVPEVPEGELAERAERLASALSGSAG